MSHEKPTVQQFLQYGKDKISERVAPLRGKAKDRDLDALPELFQTGVISLLRQADSNGVGMGDAMTSERAQELLRRMTRQMDQVSGGGKIGNVIATRNRLFLEAAHEALEGLGVSHRMPRSQPFNAMGTLDEIDAGMRFPVHHAPLVTRAASTRASLPPAPTGPSLPAAPTGLSLLPAPTEASLPPTSELTPITLHDFTEQALALTARNLETLANDLSRDEQQAVLADMRARVREAMGSKYPRLEPQNWMTPTIVQDLMRGMSHRLETLQKEGKTDAPQQRAALAVVRELVQDRSMKERLTLGRYAPPVEHFAEPMGDAAHAAPIDEKTAAELSFASAPPDSSSAYHEEERMLPFADFPAHEAHAARAATVENVLIPEPGVPLLEWEPPTPAPKIAAEVAAETLPFAGHSVGIAQARFGQLRDLPLSEFHRLVGSPLPLSTFLAATPTGLPSPAGETDARRALANACVDEWRRLTEGAPTAAADEPVEPEVSTRAKKAEPPSRAAPITRRLSPTAIKKLEDAQNEAAADFHGAWEAINELGQRAGYDQLDRTLLLDAKPAAMLALTPDDFAACSNHLLKSVYSMAMHRTRHDSIEGHLDKAQAAHARLHEAREQLCDADLPKSATR